MPACIFTNLPEIDPNTLGDRMRVPFTTTNSGSAALSREIDSPPFADSIRTTLEATGVESSPDSRWMASILARLRKRSHRAAADKHPPPGKPPTAPPGAPPVRNPPAGFSLLDD